MSVHMRGERVGDSDNHGLWAAAHGMVRVGASFRFILVRFIPMLILCSPARVRGMRHTSFASHFARCALRSQHWQSIPPVAFKGIDKASLLVSRNGSTTSLTRISSAFCPRSHPWDTASVEAAERLRARDTIHTSHSGWRGLHRAVHTCAAWSHYRRLRGRGCECGLSAAARS